MNFALQRFGQYKQSEQASSLKTRDYKDATDLVVRGGGYQTDGASPQNMEGGDGMKDVSTVVRRLTPL